LAGPAPVAEIASSVPSDLPGYRPLLAHRLRAPAVAAIVLAVIVITVLGIHHADEEVPGCLDGHLDALISSWLYRDHVITGALVTLGDPAPIAILIAVVAGGAAAARRWSGVLLPIIGTITAATLTEVILKPLIGRLLSGHLSFPSGHTTAVAAVAVAAAVLIVSGRWPRSAALRILAGVTTVVVASGVAISLVALRIHYLTDTVAGACVAIATVLAIALGLDHWCQPGTARQGGDGGLAG